MLAKSVEDEAAALQVVSRLHVREVDVGCGAGDQAHTCREGESESRDDGADTRVKAGGSLRAMDEAHW